MRPWPNVFPLHCGRARSDYETNGYFSFKPCAQINLIGACEMFEPCPEPPEPPPSLMCRLWAWIKAAAHA